MRSSEAKSAVIVFILTLVLLIGWSGKKEPSTASQAASPTPSPVTLVSSAR